MHDEPLTDEELLRRSIEGLRNATLQASSDGWRR